MNTSKLEKNGFFGSLKKVFRPSSSRKVGKLAERLEQSRLALSQSLGAKLYYNIEKIEKDDVLQSIQDDYKNLLETAEEMLEERAAIEDIITSSTKLESLDDLEMAQNYLTSLAQSQEVCQKFINLFFLVFFV